MKRKTIVCAASVAVLQTAFVSCVLFSSLGNFLLDPSVWQVVLFLVVSNALFFFLTGIIFKITNFEGSIGGWGYLLAWGVGVGALSVAYYSGVALL